MMGRHDTVGDGDQELVRMHCFRWVGCGGCVVLPPNASALFALCIGTV
jgi:hypothetical protein